MLIALFGKIPMKLLSSLIAFTVVLAASLMAQEHSSTQTVSVDFPDESRAVVLRNIADLFELNVIIPENLPGHVSLKLQQRGWKEIYDEVLKPVGFAWREENGIVRVYDAMPELRVVTPPIPAVPTAAVSRERPVSAINSPLWMLLGISVVAFAAAVITSIKRPSEIHCSTISSGGSLVTGVAAIIRITAITYFLQLVSGLGSLATYISIYQRSRELTNGGAGLVGLVATAAVALFELSVGLGLWFSAKPISAWLIHSLNKEPKGVEPNQALLPTTLAVTPAASHPSRQP